MIAKLGFILLVVAFGIGMFVAGTLAPASLRDQISATTRQLAGQGTAAQTTASPPAAKAAADDKKEKPIPYQSLLLHTPLPDKAKYALQVGMFSDPTAANRMSEQLTKLGYTASIIDVVDNDQQTWHVVASGSFDNIADIEAPRIRLAQALGLSQAPSTILLPPPPKPAK